MLRTLSYRRPAYVSKGSSSSSEYGESEGSIRSGRTAAIVNGIPASLSFDRMMQGATFKPCTVRDFMNYLLYVEHAAENLQFFLWFKYYEKRFADLPPNEKALSQPWTSPKENPFSPRANVLQPPPKAVTHDFFRGTSFDDTYLRSEKIGNPFDDLLFSFDKDDSSTLNSSVKQDIKKSVAMAYEGADIKLQPFTVQPFREEITRIIAVYIADDAPRQLNLSARERNELLQALAETTHPSAFRKAARSIETSLRFQAHPNFIRWAIGNCNHPRLRFGGALGISTTLLGLILVILLTLSSAARPWRVIAAIPLILGIAMLFCAWQNLCLVLHLFHHQHLRPWELFANENNVEADEGLKSVSTDSFDSSNSYEDEPWVESYGKRNLIRKIFDREVWIQEPAMRRIHNIIAIQATLSGLLASGIIIGVFCAVPQMSRF